MGYKTGAEDEGPGNAKYDSPLQENGCPDKVVLAPGTDAPRRNPSDLPISYDMVIDNSGRDRWFAFRG
jgi:hypothetical protein